MARRVTAFRGLFRSGRDGLSRGFMRHLRGGPAHAFNSEISTTSRSPLGSLYLPCSTPSFPSPPTTPHPTTSFHLNPPTTPPAPPPRCSHCRHFRLLTLGTGACLWQLDVTQPPRPPFASHLFHPWSTLQAPQPSSAWWHLALFPSLSASFQDPQTPVRSGPLSFRPWGAQSSSHLSLPPSGSSPHNS